MGTPKLIISGCLTPDLIHYAKQTAPDASIITTHNIKSIAKALKIKIEILEKTNYIKINLPKVRKNPVISIVPILSGCAGSCGYCSVRAVKGELISYPIKNILDEINQSLKDGCKEVWITSQDNSAYGLDKSSKTQLPELLKQITAMNQNFKIRIGMMNPNHVIPILDELIEIYKHDKIFKFLHIPVQSGNDEILKAMNRNYKVKDFERIIKEFRKQIPSITISTDIICGFPGETKQQFNDSIELIKRIKPDALNISRFHARPGTKAAQMKNQINGNETQVRSAYLTKVFHEISLSNNKRWLNWSGTILIDEKGKNNTFIGRNFAYKPVIVKGNHKLGDETEVKIKEITKHDLRC